jgi:hypothetical protein
MKKALALSLLLALTGVLFLAGGCGSNTATTTSSSPMDYSRIAADYINATNPENYLVLNRDGTFEGSSGMVQPDGSMTREQGHYYVNGDDVLLVIEGVGGAVTAQRHLTLKMNRLIGPPVPPDTAESMYVRSPSMSTPQEPQY